MDAQQLARAKMAEFRLSQAQLEEGSRQLEAISQAIAETQGAVAAIDSLPSSTAPSLIPLGAGAYAKATIADRNSILVEVGGRVITEKPAAEAKAFLLSRQSDLEKASTSIKSELERVSGRAQQLQVELSRQEGV